MDAVGGKKLTSEIFKDLLPKQILAGTGRYWPIFEKNVVRQVATVRPMSKQKRPEPIPENAIVPCLSKIPMLLKLCQEAGCEFDPFPCHTKRKDFNRLLPLGEGVYQEEYEIEAILDHRNTDGNFMYFVKWKGWDHDFNTWEPSKNLAHCQKLLEGYRKNMTEINKLKRKFGEDFSSVVKKQEQLLDIIQRATNAQDVATLLKLSGKTLLEFHGTKLKLLSEELTNIVNRYVPSKNGENNSSKEPITEILNSKKGISSSLRSFAEERLEVLIALKQWRKELNDLKGMQMPIEIENDVDLEGPPKKFTYITDYKPQGGIIINDDPPIGCQCVGSCFENRNECCAALSGSVFAYNVKGTLVIPHGTPLYECNKRCSCQKNCANRVVQKGRSIRLSIFRTHNGRGWGVKTLERIRKGCFVMEYVGEVIRSEEAEKRGKIYDEEGRTYLFDLDFEGNSEYTVDAARFGNVAHFVNHCCDPNLEVYVVWINNLDKNLPRISFFSKKEIKKGEELTFDYKMSATSSSEPTSPSNMEVMTSRIGTSGSSLDEIPKAQKDLTPSFKRRKIDEVQDTYSDKRRVACKCGAQNCRRYLF